MPAAPEEPTDRSRDAPADHAATTRIDHHVVRSEFSSLALELDPWTGAPTRLWDDARPGFSVNLTTRLFVVSGGTEHRAPTGGLEYAETDDVHAAPHRQGPVEVHEVARLTGRTFVVHATSTQPDQWAFTWHIELRAQHPRVAVSVDVHAVTGDAVARNVHLDIAAALPEPHRWQVHAPGNQLRPGLPWPAFTRATGISPAGGLRGSTGLVAVDDPEGETTLVLWPLSRTEVSDIVLAPTADGVVVRWGTDVAGQPGTVVPLKVDAFYLDLLPAVYDEVLAGLPAWLDGLGIRTPGEAPDWVQRACIYEVQIGFSVFGTTRYEPYPTAQHLLEDLDRIWSLGFNTLQIMPRQPYPSYNVHDYADITTSYGDQEVILQIVRATHAAGHHVILDILLHGVVDGESIAQAVDAIRSGPFADRLSEETLDSFALDLSAADAYLIAWSRHLIDFEPYWVGGSPRHHPLTDEHPEWFCRDSAGQVTGVYTKAFDVAHPRWQEWFRQACLHLVDVLGVDGFRFDAPTYNYFHNWSLRTRANAGVSMLGALPLFDDLRLELKARNPQAMLYTEPSGVLLRQSMDVNYNYDEQWLLTAVMGGGDDPQWVADAADLGRWIEERDASLPEGAVTAHHIDSHDTFWWPLPGSKWRREQFGLPATTAWMTVFALSGGPYMMFVGGEHGMEDAVRAGDRKSVV